MKALRQGHSGVSTVGLLLLGLISWWSERPAAEAQQSETQSEVELLRYIPPSATVVVLAQPRRVLTSPEWEMFPVEIMSAQGKRDLGFDPVEITRILVVVEMKLPMPPQVAVAARFASPLDTENVLPELKENAVEERLAGRPYHRAQSPQDASFFLPDDKTLLIGDDALLRTMVANFAGPKPSKLRDMLIGMGTAPDLTVVVDFEPLRTELTRHLAMVPLPPEFASVRRIPALLRSGEVKMNLVENLDVLLTLQTEDEAAAKELESILKSLFQRLKEAMLRQITGENRGEDPVTQATAKYTQRVMDRIWDTLQLRRRGDTLTFQLRADASTQMAGVGIATALLLPAVQAARQAATRTQSSNNLKLIGLAMHSYHDMYGRFPARANFDKQGRPLLSWRVHILPFLEQAELYRQFHLDEPWDSPHNRMLIERMPDVFKSPGKNSKPGMTRYLVLVGEGTLFEGSRGRSIAEVIDGTSNTVLVVEADPDRAVPWTKPEDLPFDPDNPLAGLGHASPGGFNVLFCDGSVRFISETIDPEVWRALVSYAGGEPVVRP